MAFAGPDFSIDRDDISDCRGLGIMAGCALIVWVITGPPLRHVTELLQETREWQDAQGSAWSAYLEGEDAASGGWTGDLRPAGRRDVS
jgi:hypothetical protein